MVATPLSERFYAHVLIVGNEECWYWDACLDRQGYGAFSVLPDEMGTGYPTYRRVMGAHRVAYYLKHGEILKGAHLDHICHSSNRSCKGGPRCSHRRCVNPLHLELVSPSENSRRTFNSPSAANRGKTHCIKGHEFTQKNTYVDKENKRHCKMCRRLGARKRRAAAI